eukprot:2864416-Prorocentrum_lima.AAC.1
MLNARVRAALKGLNEDQSTTPFFTNPDAETPPEATSLGSQSITQAPATQQVTVALTGVAGRCSLALPA